MSLSATAARIRARWNGIRNNVLSGGGITEGGGIIYPASTVTDTNSDFMGDWRSADSWQRFDMWRVRNRCRQLANGNPLVQAYLRNMGNNVLSHKGVHFKSAVMSGQQHGDTTTGEPDKGANGIIEANYYEQGKAENFTTRKLGSRRDTDRLLLNKLIIDGEFFVRKIRGFDNPYRFAWQLIDPDYIDQNLNRLEPNGNMTKMGIEYDRDYKFPVAYWILLRRPNDMFYNYAQPAQQRYVRVDASEMIHVFVQNIDPEQSRGWPWIFAAVVNLFRADKFQEAALINATIGASKTTYFKKEYPIGFDGDPSMLKDDGRIVRELPMGAGEELPYGVSPVPVDMRYPDAELGPFLQAMNLATASTFGTSYATTTGDMSQANFVSSRMGQIEEREMYMGIQELFIEKWKKPAFDEELYRAMLARKVSLPISKFDKFNCPEFTGRRWQFVQPVDEWRATEIQLRLRATSLTEVIEKQGGDRDKVLAQIAKDETDLAALKIPIVFAGITSPDTQAAEEAQKPPAKPPAKKESAA